MARELVVDDANVDLDLSSIERLSSKSCVVAFVGVDFALFMMLASIARVGDGFCESSSSARTERTGHVSLVIDRVATDRGCAHRSERGYRRVHPTPPSMESWS